ncbi:MAG: signal recognition particle protein [Deltaproteobacteria bacterium]|nr:signal recognition particle protein [Deltaproteobacteria bacterium]
MFNQLSEKISGVLSNLSNTGVVKEAHIQQALRDVRMALLEADVHVSVVKDFLNRVKEKALGQELLGSQTASQKFLKIVQDELVATLGKDTKKLLLKGKQPHVILMVGLQGSGKTTSSAKLALQFRKDGRRPFLVPADFNRPAAVEQLKTLAKQIDIPAYDTDVKKDPVKTIKKAVATAKERFLDVVIVDTAGRLHVDEDMMKELKRIQKKLDDPQILFVADAMTGQDAVNVAKSFHEALTIEGVILTKMDGDAKGGAALSIQSVANCPIYFMGTGEKLNEFEPFHPERLVSRLLDRGDLLSLVEMAEKHIDEEQVEKMAKKIKKAEFDLEDFRQQLRQMKKLGSMSSLVKMLPGAKKLTKAVNMDDAEAELKKKEAIINSMTIQERRKPDLLNASRRNRIAMGSGTSVSDINRFMKEFKQMKKMMKSFSKGGFGGMNLEALKGKMGL